MLTSMVNHLSNAESIRKTIFSLPSTGGIKSLQLPSTKI